MRKKIYSYLKFFIKIRVVHFLRNVFLFLFGARPNRENWEKRILIINLEAIGDMVVFTSVLKHYKKAFPDKKIYLLLKEEISVVEDLILPFVDQIVFINYRKFGLNPFYGAKILNALKNTGFQKIINHDFSAAEIIGRIISINVGGEEIIGYEGYGLSFNRPFDLNMKKNLDFVEKNIYPYFTKIIPSIDRRQPFKLPLTHAIDHYKIIYETISGRKEMDYSTQIFLGDKTVPIPNGKYAIIVLGSSVAYKNWPVERFAEVSKVFKEKGWKVVLLGSPNEKYLAKKFVELYDGDCLNLVGQFNISGVAQMINSAELLLSNDTGPVHIAVALKKPSVAILGGGHFGIISLYGNPEINKWVYKKQDCFGDNWRCIHNVAPGQPAQCVESVSVNDILPVVRQLMLVQ